MSRRPQTRFAADYVPTNLTEEALADFKAVLGESEARWGTARARRTRDRLLAHFDRIANGTAVGHRRTDVVTEEVTLFIVERPFVIAYSPQTRFVLLLAHGRRNLPDLFPATF